MNINQIGWSPFFETAFLPYSTNGFIPARIVRQDKHHYILHNGSALCSGTLLGKLLYEADDASTLPAVGDWVVVQPFDDNQVVIHDILPRFSAFYRKEAGQLTRKQIIASNIDTAFLVSGLDNDLNLRRIERYLVQVSNSGASPVILLNKSDLITNVDETIKRVQQVARGIPVWPLSVKAMSGFEMLEQYLQVGKTLAFLGSSGVGKSSIVNVLAGRDFQQTGAVRKDDQRGRHTTSHRELFVLPKGGVVMDTPGLRELQLWGDESDLQSVFADIEELAEKCRFNDCRHDVEPGCSVKQALEDGKLDEARFNSYQKLKRELAFLSQRQDEVAQMKAKKREKDFGKLLKQIKKHNPKR